MHDGRKLIEEEGVAAARRLATSTAERIHDAPVIEELRLQRRGRAALTSEVASQVKQKSGGCAVGTIQAVTRPGLRLVGLGGTAASQKQASHS